MSITQVSRGYRQTVDRPTKAVFEDAMSASSDDSIDHCVATIQQLIGGAVSLRSEDPKIARASDLALAAAVALGGELGEGPVIDVVAGARAVFCPDLTETELWPKWAPRAIGLGWRSRLSIQVLGRDGDLLGVLSHADHQLREEAETAEELANLAAQLGEPLTARTERRP